MSRVEGIVSLLTSTYEELSLWKIYLWPSPSVVVSMGVEVPFDKKEYYVYTDISHKIDIIRGSKDSAASIAIKDLDVYQKAHEMGNALFVYRALL